MNGLRRLRLKCSDRGDACLALLLSGIELYVSLGREEELLEMMRDQAEELRESIQGTPTADELRRLFEADNTR